MLPQRGLDEERFRELDDVVENDGSHTAESTGDDERRDEEAAREAPHVVPELRHARWGQSFSCAFSKVSRARMLLDVENAQLKL